MHTSPVFYTCFGSSVQQEMITDLGDGWLVVASYRNHPNRAKTTELVRAEKGELGSLCPGQGRVCTQQIATQLAHTVPVQDSDSDDAELLAQSLSLISEFADHFNTRAPHLLRSFRHIIQRVQSHKGWRSTPKSCHESTLLKAHNEHFSDRIGQAALLDLGAGGVF